MGVQQYGVFMVSLFRGRVNSVVHRKIRFVVGVSCFLVLQAILVPNAAAVRCSNCLSPSVRSVGTRIDIQPERTFRLPGAKLNDYQAQLFQTDMKLALTESAAVISYPGPTETRIAAFERKIGKQLWSVPRDIDSGRARLNEGRWELIGATNKGKQEIAVLLRLPLGPEYSKLLKDGDLALFGLDARSGTVIWRVPLPAPRPGQGPPKIGFVGGVITFADHTGHLAGDAATNRQWRPYRVTFRDAFTGAPLAAASRPGDHPTEHGPGSVVSRLVLIQTAAYTPCLLLPDSTLCITLPIFRTIYLGSTGIPVCSTDNRAVVLVRTDEDGMGHAQWPQYLYCVDAMGRKSWQFPRLLVFPNGMQPEQQARDYETINQACLTPNAGMVIGQGEDLGGRVLGLHGIDVVSGKVAWTQRMPGMFVLSMAEFRKGCFALLASGRPVEMANARELVYVEARTGRLRRLGHPPAALRLWARGGELFVLTSEGKIQLYSCRQLLKTAG